MMMEQSKQELKRVEVLAQGTSNKAPAVRVGLTMIIPTIRRLIRP